MSEPVERSVRLADGSDATVVGVLLDAFNREFGDPTPGARAMGARVNELLDADEITVLLAGPPQRPDGLAVARFRAALWTPGLECYLAELYVVPERRGRGIGRALMEATIEHARERGATYMELGTSQDDVAARALYESLGFSNREGRPDGPVNYYYERRL